MLGIKIERKTFRGTAGGPGRVLFDDFELSIPKSQVCVIVGPSGIGKSTLLSIVAGLGGDFDGRVRGHPSPLGFAFQTPRLLPWLTARRNVELAIPGREGDAAGWLDAVGLSGCGDLYPRHLSLGMARRVGLARALAVRPALLLLDEPFASLDAPTAEAICALLRTEIEARRPTVLLVTHDLSLASPLAHRVVTLEGSPASIVRDMGLARGGLDADPRTASAG